MLQEFLLQVTQDWSSWDELRLGPGVLDSVLELASSCCITEKVHCTCLMLILFVCVFLPEYQREIGLAPSVQRRFLWFGGAGKQWQDHFCQMMSHTIVILWPPPGHSLCTVGGPRSSFCLQGLRSRIHCPETVSVTKLSLEWKTLRG